MGKKKKFGGKSFFPFPIVWENEWLSVRGRKRERSETAKLVPPPSSLFFWRRKFGRKEWNFFFLGWGRPSFEAFFLAAHKKRSEGRKEEDAKLAV